MLFLQDTYESSLDPIFRLRPSFLFRNGIFSPLKRSLLKKYSTVIKIKGSRDIEFYRDFLKKELDTNELQIEIIRSEENAFRPSDLLYGFIDQFMEDIKFLNRDEYPWVKDHHFPIEGDPKDIWISKGVQISNPSVLDATEGPIVIDEGVTISPFCHLKGPLYIGPQTKLNHVNISVSSIGMECRLGGEINSCLIGNYTNKNHEGFLGHSIIGDWVNLGALTTTSNLKNNYGMIQIEYQGRSFQTNVQKFGSIIGDFSKTAIGTMLNTGTIIDIAVNLHHGVSNQKYYPPFFWGGKPTIYDHDRFIKDIKFIMRRRGQKPDQLILNMLKKIHPSKVDKADPL